MSGGAETIAAVATAPGRGGIGIVRISGERALAVAERIFRRRGGGTVATARPWTLVLGTVLDPATGARLDEALAVRMPAGRSYTGEETVEIHGHGGSAVLGSILEAALAAGARSAEPGEFTRRAFLAGRIDLAQAEAVAELIAADTAAELRGALQRLGGGAGRAVEGARSRLLDLIAAVEAQLEFAEEEGWEDRFPGGEVQALAAAIAELAAAGRAGRGPEPRLRVVIAGRVNSGKSSLFNYLHGSERAIVTGDPGTTRDFIEAGALVDGVDLLLVDTAGIRDVGCEAERIGIGRSLEQVGCADLVLHLVDGSAPLEGSDLELAGRTAGRNRILAVTKADLPQALAPSDLAPLAGEAGWHSVSVLSGEGCPRLVEAIAKAVRGGAPKPGEATSPLNPRQADALRRSSGHLEAAVTAGESPAGIDRAAEELRSALAALDEIAGSGVAGEVLERIFSRFCIGK